MRMPIIAAITLWLASCTIATTSTDGDADKLLQIEEDWAGVMQDLDDACKDIDKQLLKNPNGDLSIVAARAKEAAEGMSLGYGELDHKHVPGFASMSRDCESWFLQIEIEAKQGRRVIAADLFRAGRKQHCARCHDAYDAHGASK